MEQITEQTTMQVTEQTREEILNATIALFNEKGLKFTMDDLAKHLRRSKKTIYQIIPDKQTLLDAMVDYVFDSIKQSERSYLEDPDLELTEKLRRVLGAMPEQFATVDFKQLFVLKEKYPKVYAHVEERLESGWEPTVSLIREGVQKGIFRDIQVPVFRTMMQATLEQFFQRGVLVENQISYADALEEVVTTLIDGIRI